VTADGATTFSSVGDTVQMAATARDARNNLISGATFTWRSDSTTVATVSTAGLVTARANGTTLIHARTPNNADGSLSVTVSQVATSATISPTSTAVAQGLILSFTATARDARGNVVPGQVTWSSSNNAIASINASGIATGVAAGGPVTITATVAGFTPTAQLWTAAVYPWDFGDNGQMISITRGQYVSWRNTTATASMRHSVVADDGSFSTPLLAQNEVSAPIQINLSAGPYGYHCNPHAGSMRGTMTVNN
jgi:uncharacterized protein YjdB